VIVSRTRGPWIASVKFNPAQRRTLTPGTPQRHLCAQELFMARMVRGVALCATISIGLGSAALAADKAFKRDDLADAAIKLEAQIKSEAGTITKSAPTLRADADATFKRADFRSGLQIFGQSQPSYRPTAATGCASRGQSSRSDPPQVRNRPSCSSEPPPPISPTSGRTILLSRLMH
jgi:hypothetical protein